MKTRVTFRVADELALALRALPNQTRFVEAALSRALGVTCPLCHGEGRLMGARLRLTNFRAAALPRLDRETALQLRALVGIARKLGATDVDLGAETEVPTDLHFLMRRGEAVLLQGSVSRRALTIH